MSTNTLPDIRTLLERAVAAYHTGDRRTAERALKAVLCREPAQFDANHLLGLVLYETARSDAGLPLLLRAARIRPGIADLHQNLGLVLMLTGRTDAALQSFDAALAAKPGHVMARFCRAITQIPIVYRDEADIERRRAAYRADLEELAAEAETLAARHGEAALAAWSGAVGSLQPFYLAYQGRCNRDLQQLYGALCHRVMTAAYPACARQPPMPPPDDDGRLRIGFLSGFFSNHSNWKIRIRTWLERLDRGRFRRFGYYTRGLRDADTALAEELCDRFVQGPLPFERWIEEIRADNLHALIIPEIGMDQTTGRLAALHLAPVQATSWGHPDTSGLPSIGYYLSSDLMETEGAEAHYTETLVRLPNLSFCYLPRPPRPVAVRRADIGVREDAAMFWCCQSFAKYLPAYDRLFARIARQVPGAQFVFIRSYLGEAVDAVFRERLRAAFAAEGVAWEGACIFLEHMDYDRFNAVAALADVALDTPLWSGCNTTLETLAHGVPVVTLPGELMRGRHSHAILTMIGVGETIARSPGEFVDIACRLASDRTWRAQVSARITANLPRAYGDMEAVRGLERFLEDAVARAS